ncbi:MAG: chemotaxis protein CheV [Candidatus Thermoplasmatota archaeon]|nr:chemotaxis protein CheV [Candidatus Thermoplasmatota archaeon]
MENKNEHQEILLETGTNEVEIAEFGIYLKGGERYQSFGINVAKIREIIKTPEYMSIPTSHKNVLGVFKLRDKIIPLVDLGGWLNEGECDNYDTTYVIVAEFNQDNFGFLVHKIETIHRMSWEKVLPPAQVQHDIRKNCITGIVPLGDDEKKLMLMVDFEKIVADINPEVSLSIKSDKHIIDQLDGGNPPPKVLLAEDSSIVRDLLKGILEDGGFDVVSVDTGKRAWDYVSKWKKDSLESERLLTDYVQLVVTDIEMPQMDGHSLLRKIKEDDQMKQIPVILFSSLIYEEIRRKGNLLGADAQISKPEIGNLLNIVEDVLEKHKTVE